MSLNDGERQVAPTRDGIRRDHVARYEWAAGRLIPGSRALDLACGIGYGSQLLAYKGLVRVLGVDRDGEAIQYARRHYRHQGVTYLEADAADPALDLGQHDAAVCFETIEHLDDPLELLKKLREAAPLLFVSVPNQDEHPWNASYKFHHRHYTPGQFEALLNSAGWMVCEWSGQRGDDSEVEPGMRGRTIIAACRRCEIVKHKDLRTRPQEDGGEAPAHVAILGLGPSVKTYLELTKRMGGRRKFADETWSINALGDVFVCDRIFHMDDVRIQEIRAAAAPDSNIAAMLKWLRTHPGPVYTSRTHEDYPGLVAYPLEAVVDSTGYAYMNNTAAYAVAYAIYIGVKKITVFGCDFTYENSHHAEKGRACVEFWLGIAAARGIKLSIPQSSSLMDGCEPMAEKLYGYDTLDVAIGRNAEGRIKLDFTEKKKLPTAEEIEHRYDHTRHPNALVEATEIKE